MRLPQYTWLLLGLFSLQRKPHRSSARRSQFNWLHRGLFSLVMLTSLFLPGIVMAQESVTVQLEAVDGSGVGGTATLTADGEGTEVVLEVQGLAPGATARAAMQANTCAMPSASFASLPDLQADGTGQATAAGRVLFRGAEDVALATMADGEHVITVQTEQMVACGVIPKPTSASSPTSLPGTGGDAPWLIIATVGLLGLGVLFAGLYLRRSHRPL